MMMVIIKWSGLRGCKNRAHSVSWPEVLKGVTYQDVGCSVSEGSFSDSLLCLWCEWCCVFLFLVVSTSVIDYLERLVSEMTYFVSSGMLKPYTLTYAISFSCQKSNVPNFDLSNQVWCSSV